MDRFAVSFCLFWKQHLPAFALAGAIIIDPGKWPKASGMTDDTWTLLSLADWQRQAIFALCLFGWLFYRFHENRIAWEDRREEWPNMPIREAFLYLARDSEWAVRNPVPVDRNWIFEVAKQMDGAFGRGDIIVFGQRREKGKKHANDGEDIIPAEFTKKAHWNYGDVFDPSKMILMWGINGVEQFNPLDSSERFLNLMVDARRVRRIWPKATLWSKIRDMPRVEKLNKMHELQ